MELYHWTLSAALALLALELLLPAFFFAGLAIGVASVAAVHFFTGDIQVARDFLVLAAASAAAFVGLRRYFRRPSDSSSERSDVNRY